MTAHTDIDNIDIDEKAYQYLKFLYMLYGDIQFSYHVYASKNNPHKEQMKPLLNSNLFNSGCITGIDFDPIDGQKYILTKKFWERLDKE